MQEITKLTCTVDLVLSEKGLRHLSNLEKGDPLKISLQHDPGDNSHAIAVHSGRHAIGFVPSEMAEALAPALRAGLDPDVYVVNLAAGETPSDTTLEIVVFVEPKRGHEQQKWRLPGDEVKRDHFDLYVAIIVWIFFGGLFVLVLFFIYWMLIRPALTG